MVFRPERTECHSVLRKETLTHSLHSANFAVRGNHRRGDPFGEGLGLFVDLAAESLCFGEAQFRLGKQPIDAPHQKIGDNRRDQKEDKGVEGDPDN